MKFEANVKSVEEGLEFGRKRGFPIELSSAFSLCWRKTADNIDQLRELLEDGLKLSPIDEVQLRRI